MNHNKKRNTGILFEILVQAFSTAVIKKDETKIAHITSLLKEFFNPRTILKKELKILQSLNEYDMDEKDAKRLIKETRKLYLDEIDQERLFNEQTRLITKINQLLSKSAFSTFIPNYKSLATIGQIFDTKMPIKKRIMLENNLIKKLTAKSCKCDELKPLTKLEFHSLVKGFNEKYQHLHESQRSLLQKYISTSHTNDSELKLYLNEEVGRLKESLKDCKVENEELQTKIEEVKIVLDDYRKKPITEELITQTLHIQSLVEEISS